MDINKNTFIFAVIMRNIVATIMLFLFLSQWGFKNAVVVLYSYYQNEIASNYCENRFSNQTNCKGKCFLNKQILDLPSHKTTPFALSKIKSELYYVEDIFKIVFLCSDIENNATSFYQYFDCEGFSEMITPPPKSI